MRLMPRIKYNEFVMIEVNGDIFAEKGKDISLSGILIENGFLKKYDVGTRVSLSLNIGNDKVNLNGKILRKSDKLVFVKFLEDALVISKTVGEFITNEIYKNGRCPFCDSIISKDETRCPKCRMFLDFSNPELVNVLLNIDIAELIETILKKDKSECYQLKEETFEMIGTSQKMKEVFNLIRKYALTDFPVLIIGESGTGKELTAKAIHERSLRKDKPYIVVDCASIPENLLESELFGYEKGAFTGADKRKIGRIELAEGGTLFLDEIGDLPLSLQVKLLRFLENFTFTRVGGTDTIRVDVRIIAATNVDLEKAVREKRFREDLYYRLNCLTIHLPPLREREDDIEVIAKYFSNKFSKEIGKNIKGFTPSAMESLKRYSWPGNVRELLNMIRKAVVMAEGEYIDIKDLDKKITENFTTKSHDRFSKLESIKADYFKKVFKDTNGNISKMSNILGISRPTVYKLIEKYGLKDY